MHAKKNQENEKTIYSIEEKFCKPYIRESLNSQKIKLLFFEMKSYKRENDQIQLELCCGQKEDNYNPVEVN